MGSGCARSADCDAGLVCDTQLPGGYCATTCGVNGACPEGGVCIDVGFGNEVCLRACASSEDCGRPGYTCQRAPSGQFACAPLDGGGSGGAGGGGGGGPERVTIGEVCDDGLDCAPEETCQLRGPQGTCQRFCIGDCPAGYRCASDAYCVAEATCPPAADATGQACGYSYDCPSCFDCNFSECRLPCPRGNVDCPAGRSCDDFSGFCL